MTTPSDLGLVRGGASGPSASALGVGAAIATACLVVLSSVPPRLLRHLALRRPRLQRPLPCLGRLRALSLADVGTPAVPELRRTSLAHGARRVSHEPLPGDLARVRAARSRARARRRGGRADAVHPPGAPEDLLSEADRRAAATTYSVLPTSVRRVAARAPRRARYAPRAATCRRWRWPCAPGAPGARERLWHLFYFAEAMILVQPVPPRGHRAHPRAVRRQRDRRGDAGHPLPARGSASATRSVPGAWRSTVRSSSTT